jgi:hypothetical protein
VEKRPLAVGGPAEGRRLTGWISASGSCGGTARSVHLDPTAGMGLTAGEACGDGRHCGGRGGSDTSIHEGAETVELIFRCLSVT